MVKEFGENLKDLCQLAPLSTLPMNQQEQAVKVCITDTPKIHFKLAENC
jgi:hypothetical protein